MESDQQTGKEAQRRKSGSASQSEKDKRTTSGGTHPKNRKCFEIDIFRDWCKSCGICAAFCPRECIRLDEEGAPTSSIRAGAPGAAGVRLHCPDFAISVHQRDHLKGDSA